MDHVLKSHSLKCSKSTVSKCSLGILRLSVSSLIFVYCTVKVDLMFECLEVVKIGVYCLLKWTLNSNQSRPSFLDTANPSCAWIKMTYHYSVLGKNRPFVLKQISEIQQEFISAAGLLITLLLWCINWGKFPLCNEDEDCSPPIVIYYVLRVYWDKPGLPGMLQLLIFCHYLFLLPLVLKGAALKSAAGKSPPAQRVPLQRDSSLSEAQPQRVKSTQEMTGGCLSLALICTSSVVNKLLSFKTCGCALQWNL